MYALVYFAEHRVQSVHLFTSLTAAMVAAHDFMERISPHWTFIRAEDEYPTWEGDQQDVLSIFPIGGRCS